MNNLRACSLLFLTICLGACSQEPRREPPSATAETEGENAPAPAQAERTYAVARIEARSGSQVSGTASFMGEGGPLSLSIEIEGAPAGTHAVHLHEIGDCSAPDASSAGNHWNPTHEDHGRWGDAPFHLGDIGNVEVAEDGTGRLALITDKWAIGTGSQNDVVGKSIIVHEKPDDFTTQPTGAAGGRIGCGVVETVR
jgi:Cu-Zn family superoxide dismutase